MKIIKSLLIGSMLSSAHMVAAHAQPDRTGTGGSSLSTEKAPYTTVVGQTKPPSRDASPISTEPNERLTPRQAADDAINQRVCSGCATEVGATGPSTVPVPVGARPDKRDVRLEELQSALHRQPQQQTDLDTVALASAHRAQAQSMAEKTDGLWQSWLVSVCDGCGDQKPARALKLEDWPNRNALATTGSIDHRAAAEKPRQVEAKRVEVRHYGSLEADLSPENVDSIRRMPQR